MSPRGSLSALIWVLTGAEACREHPEWFQPAESHYGHIERRHVERARAACASCPALSPCRAYALAHPGESGIWGGLTEADRRAVRAKARTQGKTM